MRAQQAFKQASAKQEQFTFNYEWEVSQFFKGREDLLDLITFVSVGPSSAKQVGGMKVQDINREHIASTVQRTREAHGACALSGGVQLGTGERSGHIFITEPLKKPAVANLLGTDAPEDAHEVFVFDHEVGHLTCKHGYGYFNLSECVADAYAMIRHFQRFGMDAAYVENVADMRAVGMVFRRESGFRGQGNHFSSPVADAIMRDSKTHDFTALTPFQTVQLAERYALNHAMQSELVRDTAKEFERFTGRLTEVAAGDSSVLRELGTYLLTTSHTEAFKWGSRALLAVLDGKVENKDGVIAPKGAEWQMLRRAIKARQTEYSRKGAMLFGIESKPRVPANGNKRPG